MILKLKYWLPPLITFLSKWLPSKISKKFSDITKSLENSLSFQGTTLLLLFLLSSLDRLCNYAMTILLVMGMGFQIPILYLVIANAAASVTNILPINNIGSFGTLELGWTGALVYFGVGSGIAAASGFGFHLLAFSFTIVLGFICLFIMKIKYNINPFEKEKRIVVK
jgi:uncharacterized membrane protein YbhN (UPF0104 family)